MLRNRITSQEEETLTQQLKDFLPSKIIRDLPEKLFLQLEYISEKYSDEIATLASNTNFISFLQVYSRVRCTTEKFFNQLKKLLFSVKVADVFPKLSFLAILATLMPTYAVAQRYSIFSGVPSGQGNTCPSDESLIFDCVQGFIVDLAKNATTVVQFNRVVGLDSSTRNLDIYNKLLSCFDVTNLGNIVINSLNFTATEECNYESTVSNDWLFNSLTQAGNVDCSAFYNTLSTAIDSCLDSPPAYLRPLDMAFIYGLPSLFCVVVLLAALLYYKNRRQNNTPIAFVP